MKYSGIDLHSNNAVVAVNEIVRLIAQIGGFLGRKSDGEPGAKTIWRGLDKVLAAADTLRALRDGLG